MPSTGMSRPVLPAIFLFLIFAGSVVQAQSACKGLSSGQCSTKSGCLWVGGYSRTDGRKVKGYCRAKGGKRATSGSTTQEKDSTSKRTTKKSTTADKTAVKTTSSKKQKATKSAPAKKSSGKKVKAKAAASKQKSTKAPTSSEKKKAKAKKKPKK